MLIFITTVRHPLNANSYLKVESLLYRTLKSVCNQTDRNFKVIVVCNQLPEFERSFKRIEFINVDFDPPSPIKSAMTGIEAARIDKGVKYVVGLKHCAKYSPDYIMFFDADDLVSNQIAAFVNTHPEQNGWYIDKGYRYRDGGFLVSRQFNFHKSCGTSIIINSGLLDFYADLPEAPSRQQILDNVDNHFLKMILGSHIFTERYFEKKGLPLAPLPFAGAIWVVDSGENHSGASISGFMRPINKNIGDEFSLELPKSSIKQMLVDYLLLIPKSGMTELMKRLKAKIQKKI